MTCADSDTRSDPAGDGLDHLIEELHRSRDPAQRQRLRAEVVTSTLDLADRLAHRYLGRGIDREDLEQVARTALVAAVDRYDPSRGRGFRAFAVPTITGELKRHFRDTAWVVRPPRRVQEMRARVTAIEGPLSQRMGRDATIEEIAREIGCSPDEVRESRRVGSCFRPTSLNAPMPAGDEAADRVPDPVDRFAAAETNMVLQSMMVGLAPRDRLIVRLRFVDGWTQAEIGSVIGVSQMQVSRRLGRILDDLRARCESPTPDLVGRRHTRAFRGAAVRGHRYVNRTDRTDGATSWDIAV